MTVRRRAALLVLLAVLGIILAAAATWGTSQLVRQHIGLASEPITAGRQLSRGEALPEATGPAGSAGPQRAAPTAASLGTNGSRGTPSGSEPGESRSHQDD